MGRSTCGNCASEDREHSPHIYQNCATPAAVTKDVDPLALDVLRAVAEPVEKAQSFSFKALVGEEELATDGQIVTFFHSVD
jgi:hypothetical protein